MRQLGIHVIEHGLDARLADGQVFRDLAFNQLGRFLDERIILLARPRALVDQVAAQPRDRFAFPRLLDLFPVAVARRVIGGGVIGQPVGHHFNNGCTLAGTGALQRLFHHPSACNQVVAVDLNGGQSRGNALLGQRFGMVLLAAGHRDSPLIVDDDQHQG